MQLGRLTPSQRLEKLLAAGTTKEDIASAEKVRHVVAAGRRETNAALMDMLSELQHDALGCPSSMSASSADFKGSLAERYQRSFNTHALFRKIAINMASAARRRAARAAQAAAQTQAKRMQPRREKEKEQQQEKDGDSQACQEAVAQVSSGGGPADTDAMTGLVYEVDVVPVPAPTEERGGLLLLLPPAVRRAR
jgi:hypothetical protein